MFWYGVLVPDNAHQYSVVRNTFIRANALWFHISSANYKMAVILCSSVASSQGSLWRISACLLATTLTRVLVKKINL